MGTPMRRLSPDPDRKWALEIGRFMLAFGDIEHTSIACLCGIPSDSFGKVTATMSLGLRLELLEAILEGRNQHEYVALATETARVMKFLSNRNLVAHNPVQFSFYRNNDGSGVSIQTELVSTRNRNKRLAIEQLTALANEAENLAEAFSDAAVTVFQKFQPPEPIENWLGD